MKRPMQYRPRRIPRHPPRCSLVCFVVAIPSSFLPHGVAGIAVEFGVAVSCAAVVPAAAAAAAAAVSLHLLLRHTVDQTDSIRDCCCSRSWCSWVGRQSWGRRSSLPPRPRHFPLYYYTLVAFVCVYAFVSVFVCGLYEHRPFWCCYLHSHLFHLFFPLFSTSRLTRCSTLDSSLQAFNEFQAGENLFLRLEVEVGAGTWNSMELGRNSKLEAGPASKVWWNPGKRILRMTGSLELASTFD